MLYKHASGPGTLDLHFTLHWHCQAFMSSGFSLIARIMNPCILIIRDIHSSTLTRYPWPTFHAPFTLSEFYVKNNSIAYFSVPMIARIMKPCKVIALHIVYKHISWPVTIDLYFMLHWLCLNFTKVRFFLTAIARSMNPCIAIVLDILNKHVPWPGTIDLHLTLHWLCQYITLTLNMIILPDAGAISTSAEFLFKIKDFHFKLFCLGTKRNLNGISVRWAPVTTELFTL